MDKSHSKKRIKIIIVLVLAIGIIASFGVKLYLKYEVDKEKQEDIANTQEWEDCFNGIYNAVKMENIAKANGFDWDNKELISIKKDYEEVLNHIKEEEENTLLLAQYIIVNDYMGIDNDKNYNVIDKRYNKETKLLGDYAVDNSQDLDISGAVRVSALCIFYYDGTTFVNKLINDYKIVDGLENVYNNAEELCGDEAQELRSYIANVFATCNIESDIDYALVKDHYADELGNVIKIEKKRKGKITLDDYMYRYLPDKFRVIGVDDKKVKELEDLIAKYDLNQLRDNNYGFGKDITLSSLGEYEVNLRREMYREDSLFKDTQFCDKFREFCDEYTQNILIPAFNRYYNNIKDEFKTSIFD